MTVLARATAAVRAASPLRPTGRLRDVTPFLLRCTGAGAGLHEQVEVEADGGTGRDGVVRAEVVALRGDEAILLPLGDARSAVPGAFVRKTGRRPEIRVGGGLLGRVLDGLGSPLDGRPLPPGLTAWEVWGPGRPGPLERPRLAAPFATGVRAVDGFATLAEGQRVGLFAGPGAGKSSLLGRLARGSGAEVCVLGLVGERGREVREMVEDALGTEGLRRSVVVAATSDAPAVVRMRASAQVATAVAEWFARVEGLSVLLLIDSLTRFARAVREVGLGAGEAPVRQGSRPGSSPSFPGSWSGQAPGRGAPSRRCTRCSPEGTRPKSDVGGDPGAARRPPGARQAHRGGRAPPGPGRRREPVAGHACGHRGRAASRGGEGAEGHRPVGGCPGPRGGWGLGAWCRPRGSTRPRTRCRPSRPSSGRRGPGRRRSRRPSRPSPGSAPGSTREGLGARAALLARGRRRRSAPRGAWPSGGPRRPRARGEADGITARAEEERRRAVASPAAPDATSAGALAAELAASSAPPSTGSPGGWRGRGSWRRNGPRGRGTARRRRPPTCVSSRGGPTRSRAAPHDGRSGGDAPGRLPGSGRSRRRGAVSAGRSRPCPAGRPRRAASGAGRGARALRRARTGPGRAPPAPGGAGPAARFARCGRG